MSSRQPGARRAVFASPAAIGGQASGGGPTSDGTLSGEAVTPAVEQLASQQAAARTTESAGLRERKKVATRQSLGEAAMRLAIERGLERVLVEDIADAAGVSTRTFNNYFASKYEAICALQHDRALRIGDELRARPASEPLWDSITHAVLSQFGPTGHVPDSEVMARIRLVVTTPALIGEYLKAQGMAQYHLAEVIAERLRTSLDTDTFPRIMAGAVTAAMQAAMERWLHSDPPVPLEPLIRSSFRQFVTGMHDVLPPSDAPGKASTTRRKRDSC